MDRGIKLEFSDQKLSSEKDFEKNHSLEGKIELLTRMLEKQKFDFDKKYSI